MNQPSISRMINLCSFCPSEVGFDEIIEMQILIVPRMRGDWPLAGPSICHKNAWLKLLNPMVLSFAFSTAKVEPSVVEGTQLFIVLSCPILPTPSTGDSVSLNKEK